MRQPLVHGDFKPSDVLVTASAKSPKITNFGLWDFKKFFIENTMAEDVVFLNPHNCVGRSLFQQKGEVKRKGK